MSDDDMTAGGRRSFLRKGAVAAGALWMVPAISSTPAFAGHSCSVFSTLDWSVEFPGGGTPTPPVVVDGTTVTSSHAFSGATPNPNPFSVSYVQSGSITGYVRMGWPGGAGAGGTGDNQTALFSFSSTVQDLSFTLTDIDADGTWRDTVTISATGPGTRAISGTPVAPAATTTVVGATPTWNGNPARGNAGSSTVDGNLAVTILGQIDSFTVFYAAGPETGASQHIGIYNLSWCT